MLCEGPHGANVRRAKQNRTDRRSRITLPLFPRPHLAIEDVSQELFVACGVTRKTAGTRHSPFDSTPMAVNSISSGPPHVRCTPMGRTCGEPDETKKNTHLKDITALFREQAKCGARPARRATAGAGGNVIVIACQKPSTNPWVGGRFGFGWRSGTARAIYPRVGPQHVW